MTSAYDSAGFSSSGSLLDTAWSEDIASAATPTSAAATEEWRRETRWGG